MGRRAAAGLSLRQLRPLQAAASDAQVVQAAQQQAEHELIVSLEDFAKGKAKLRLDAFLSARLPAASRARLQASIKEGLVVVNGRPQPKASYGVKPGDLVACSVLPPPPLEASPEALPLAIVYEDEHLLVINKASDMVMHPAPGHYTGTLVNALLHHCQLPAMQLAQGGAAPLSLEGAAAAAAAAREDASSSGREGDAGASSSGSGGADDERLDQHAAAAAADAAAGQAAGHSGPAASASALASASTSAGPAEQSELEGDEDDDEGGGLLLVGPAGSAGGATIRPGIVHRLDRGTTGLLVVAKTDAAHLSLAQQFKDRTVRRTYHSITLGVPRPTQGRVATYVGRDLRDRKRMAAFAYASARGRTAASNYKVLEPLAGGGAALVQWRLETGRTHQIRVHAKHLGHPLFSDDTYSSTAAAGSIVGAGKPARAAAATAAARALGRPALHAKTLGFVHPATGKEMLFDSQLPSDFEAALAALRGPPFAAQDQAGGTGSSAATDGGPRCPLLSREVLAARAHHNTVMLAVANDAQWDFASNWLHFTKKAGISYYVVAAADAPASERLAAAGEPCFEWIDEAIAGMGAVGGAALECWAGRRDEGSEGWRRITWTKVFIVDAVAEWGFDLVVSDVDVVWFRDPLPLFEQHAHADLIFSTDVTNTVIEPGDQGLDLEGDAGVDVNTGVYLMRAGNGTAAWAHAWRGYFEKCPDHDQMCAYNLMREGPSPPHPEDPRVHAVWGERLWMGIVPPSLAMNAHSLFLQQLHKVKGVEPYVVHLTWTYNGIAGKRPRMRDLQLWADPPAYYAEGDFVTVDLQLPQPLRDFNLWNENEDMVAFHLASIHAQLQQAYVGWALAAAAGRAFILPKFVCYCEKIWYGVVRCRAVASQAMPLPVTCPQDYVFHPGQYSDDPDQWGPPVELARLRDAMEAAFTAEEVASLARRTAQRKAVFGPLAPWLLKQACAQLAPLAAAEFNAWQRIGRLPRGDAHSAIALVAKTSSPTQPSDLRGIAVGALLAKLFAAGLERRVTAHAEAAGLHAEGQFGFRRQRSTEQAALALRTVIECHRQQRQCGGSSTRSEQPQRRHTRRRRQRGGSQLWACFVDFKQAYDRVPRAQLWQRLESMGYGGQWLRAVRALYADVPMSVTAPGLEGRVFSATQGLKQGCPLSPTLFSLYIADWEERVLSAAAAGMPLALPQLAGQPVPPLLYADDMALLATTANGLQQQLRLLEQYCAERGLTVNVVKTKVMLLAGAADEQTAMQRVRRARHTFDGAPVAGVAAFKYLGLVFHCTQPVGEAAAEGRARVARFAAASFEGRCTALGLEAARLLLSLYRQMVDSTLSYGAAVWSPGLSLAAVRRLGTQAGAAGGGSGLSAAAQQHYRTLRRLLGLPQRAPRATVLAETGEPPLHAHWLARTARFWNSLVAAPEGSLMRQVLDASLQLAADHTPSRHRGPHGIAQMPWAAQLQSALAEADIAADLQQRQPLQPEAVQVAALQHYLQHLQTAVQRRGANRLQHYFDCVRPECLEVAGYGMAPYLVELQG
ncbi:ribosomal large subunit pseudouridine synthase D [Micractinium conductrix]|uniref:Ribosomal large subunit pseudouridine synthase D n=1 Tax=Micractinium conductrix TaxID=554055 RepID=A0A2P6V0C4_9CHLO|nr:ribosomal large subunit pseudouridine synthase D [Micractinium conductrix]|eukprot:PSC67546.1 ribosomal large subunit pseudouridine synthase D [Micractinium conductrix]